MDVKKITTEDFSSICRTCLASGTNLLSIFNEKVTEMLNYCNFCMILESDGFPSKICALCVQILKQSYEFKQRCENSYSLLAKIVAASGQNYNKLHVNAEDISVDSCDILTDALITKNEEQTVASTEILTEKDSSCKKCGKHFLDFSDLMIHTENDHCRYTNNSDKLLEYEQSQEENTNEPPIQHFEENSEDLISFLSKPLPPPLQFCCTKCNQSFSEEDDLKNHQSVHSPDLVCLACLKKFANKQMLKRHLKIHLIKKPHVCKICNKNFAESYALTKHLRRHAGIPREKKHTCTECGQGFSEPYYLKVHLRKHTGERPLLCSECHKTFADPRSFKIHVMIHSGEKPHKCNFCLKSFIQRANLTKHLRIHTGEKPYLCKVCDKGFSQSSSLDKHLRTHTGKKIY